MRKKNVRKAIQGSEGTKEKGMSVEGKKAQQRLEI